MAAGDRALEERELRRLLGTPDDVWLGLVNVDLYQPELGRGSDATVYRAEHAGQDVAVKILHGILVRPGNVGRSAFLQRFGSECRLLRRLSHPRIVNFHGLGMASNGCPCLVTELMADSLASRVGTDRTDTLFQQLTYLSDVAEGLRYLHGIGLLHRDLKAENVLISAGHAKIADVGLARFLHRDGDGGGGGGAQDVIRPEFTRCPGTPNYMPPECFRANPVYDEKLDAFSFGVLALSLLTNRPPQPPQVCVVRLPSGQEQAIPEVERRRADLARLPSDHVLRDLILTCLQDDPGLRPTAESLHVRLMEATCSSQGAADTAALRGMCQSVENRLDQVLQVLQSQSDIISQLATQSNCNNQRVGVIESAVMTTNQQLRQVAEQQREIAEQQRESKEQLSAKLEQQRGAANQHQEGLLELHTKLHGQCERLNEVDEQLRQQDEQHTFTAEQLRDKMDLQQEQLWQLQHDVQQQQRLNDQQWSQQNEHLNHLTRAIDGLHRSMDTLTRSCTSHYQHLANAGEQIAARSVGAPANAQHPHQQPHQQPHHSGVSAADLSLHPPADGNEDRQAQESAQPIMEVGDGGGGSSMASVTPAERISKIQKLYPDHSHTSSPSPNTLSPSLTTDDGGVNLEPATNVRQKTDVTSTEAFPRCRTIHTDGSGAAQHSIASPAGVPTTRDGEQTLNCPPQNATVTDGDESAAGYSDDLPIPHPAAAEADGVSAVVLTDPQTPHSKRPEPAMRQNTDVSSSPTLLNRQSVQNDDNGAARRSIASPTGVPTTGGGERKSCHRPRAAASCCGDDILRGMLHRCELLSGAQLDRLPQWKVVGSIPGDIKLCIPALLGDTLYLSTLRGNDYTPCILQNSLKTLDRPWREFPFPEPTSGVRWGTVSVFTSSSKLYCRATTDLKTVPFTIYEYCDGNWVELAQLPSVRKRASYCIDDTNGTLIVAGGQDDRDQPVLAITGTSSTSRNAAWSTAGQLLELRNFPRIVFDECHIHIIGGAGYFRDTPTTITTLTPNTHSDVHASYTHSHSTLPETPFRDTSATVVNGTVVVAGGWEQQESGSHFGKVVNDVYMLDSQKKVWLPLPPLNTACYDPCLFHSQRNLYCLWGGTNGDRSRDAITLHTIEMLEC